MDIVTIILIIGGILVALALIWATVALIGLAVMRKTTKEFNKDFDNFPNRPSNLNNNRPRY